MNRQFLYFLAIIILLLFVYLLFPETARPPLAAMPVKVTQGELYILKSDGNTTGACPLKHTSVQAEISGFLARVNVTQEFLNPLNEKIEAVYAFPLPQQAAVDDMLMQIDDRKIRSIVKPREEARAIYEIAKKSGQVASLLDQERPNIFTQSVANITPGSRVLITISYVEFLKHEEGFYQFVFPMVVGPRYIPGAPVGRQGGGWAPDTNRIPDASRITPPVTLPGTRAGHDISLEVSLDTGVPILDVSSLLHPVDILRSSPSRAQIRLQEYSTIPNKDFILKYSVSGQAIADAVLTHRETKGGYFALILQPPAHPRLETITPKELVFVLDTSGSMQGFPIEKAKETMRLALDGLNPQDTFNLITFSGDTRILFPHPVPASWENLERARAFLAASEGSGGTEMMKAIRAALAPSDAQDHLRVVCFMTDGYVGNDMEIIAEIQKHPNARVFSFGIGNSVNRFLLDKMAEYGRGEVEYVSLREDGPAAARRFHERVRNPLLTGISVNYGSLAVTDIFPERIPDLFSAKPLILCGRYLKPGRGKITVNGEIAGLPYSKVLEVILPETEPEHDVLATLWARRKIDELMGRDFAGIQSGSPAEAIQEEITHLGVEYHLMTQFTSFVAVEEMVVTDGGQPRRIDVPVEMPEGVSYRGIFGEEADAAMAVSGGTAGGMLSGIVGGVPGGVSAGVVGGVVSAPTAMQAKVALIQPPQLPPSAPPPPSTATAVQRVNVHSSRSTNEKQEAKKDSLSQKMHPALMKFREEWRRGKGLSPQSQSLLKNGKVELQLKVSEKSAAVLEKLKKLGFELVLNAANSNLLIGRIEAGKLEELARLAEVKFLAPLS